MEALKIILTVLYLLICVGIVVIVLCQDSDGEGLSAAITGGAGNSYWSKNKGRSKEGMLKKITIILTVLFVVISVLLNESFLQ